MLFHNGLFNYLLTELMIDYYCQHYAESNSGGLHLPSTPAYWYHAYVRTCISVYIHTLLIIIISAVSINYACSCIKQLASNAGYKVHDLYRQVIFVLQLDP